MLLRIWNGPTIKLTFAGKGCFHHTVIHPNCDHPRPGRTAPAEGLLPPPPLAMPVLFLLGVGIVPGFCVGSAEEEHAQKATGLRDRIVASKPVRGMEWVLGCSDSAAV